MHRHIAILLGIGAGLACLGWSAQAAGPLLVSPAAIQSGAAVAPGGANPPKTLAAGAAKPTAAVIAPDRMYSNIKSEVDLVALLRNQNRQLRALVKDLSHRLEVAQQEKPFCSDIATSANNAGMSRSCGSYICDPVQGTCLQRATSSLDCAPGYVWDSGSQCVAPPPPQGDPCPHWYSCL